MLDLGVDLEARDARVVAVGRSQDPDVCLIVVQVGLVRGWRTSLSNEAGDTAEPVPDAGG